MYSISPQELHQQAAAGFRDICQADGRRDPTVARPHEHTAPEPLHLSREDGPAFRRCDIQRQESARTDERVSSGLEKRLEEARALLRGVPERSRRAVLIDGVARVCPVVQQQESECWVGALRCFPERLPVRMRARGEEQARDLEHLRLRRNDEAEGEEQVRRQALRQA